jgi:hypothetical protein
LGYEPPQDILDAIAGLLATSGVLSVEQLALLNSLHDQLIANIGPVITSNAGGDTANISIDENDTYVTTVAATDNYSLNGTDNLTYSISGGANEALFQINATTGELTFITPPDYENGGAGSYQVIVQSNDGDLLFDTQTLTVTVNDVNDVAPVITSNGGDTTAAVSVDENTTAVTIVTSDDPDTVGAATYTISGGADAFLFNINSATGELAFNDAPDFEDPGDVGGDNIYEVTVQVSDGVQSDTQEIAVGVTNDPSDDTTTYGNLLALAYMNVDGVAGYNQESGDLLIASIEDTNGDSTISAGDIFRTGVYPLSTTNLQSHADFEVQESTIASAYQIGSEARGTLTSGESFRFNTHQADDTFLTDWWSGGEQPITTYSEQFHFYQYIPGGGV